MNWPFCLHRSHRLRLRCWRSQLWDYWCGKHNAHGCWRYSDE